MRFRFLLLGCLWMPPAAGLAAAQEAPGGSPPAMRQVSDANPTLAAIRPTQEPNNESVERPRPVPAPPAVSPGTESEARDLLPAPGAAMAESSARELQPGAGEFYIPPPPIPPVPPGMGSVNIAEGEAGGRAPLTLEQLEELACRNNPTLVQAKAVVDATFGAAIQAGLWPNPTITYMGMSQGQGGTPGMFTGGILTQPIITAGKRRLDRARFLEQTKAGQWEAMAVEYRVLNDVRFHYFHALALQAIIEVQEELVQNAEDIVVTVRESYNLGIHNLRTLHEANAALQAQRLDYLRTQNMYRHVWQKLMAVIGVQMPLTPLAGGLEGDTTPIEYDAALARILEFSPDVQKTQANLRFEQITLKWQRVQPWPNMVAVSGPGWHGPSKTVVNTTQLHLQGVPVWNWNQGNIRSANAQVVRQQAEIRRVSLKLQDDLAVVYRGYLTALQHVESYQTVVLPELRRAYELTLDSYEDDRNTWGDVLLAQRAYFKARAAYITHLAAWRQAEVLITGFLLHGGLMPAMPAGPPAMVPGAPNVTGEEMMIPASALSPPA